MAFLLLVGCAAAPSARHAPPARSNWPDLQALAGVWKGTTEGTTVDVTFTPIAKGSALAEAFGPPGRQTMTLYHADHAGLVATHYCGQGNQPRLRAPTPTPATPTTPTATTPTTGNRIVFTQADITDLDRGEAHLVEMSFELGDREFDREEVYRQADGTLERTRWHFVRAD
jgi:hypothetical protein